MKVGLAIALLPAIAVVGLYLLDQTALAALVLVAGVPLVWLAAIVLTRATRREPHLVALRERAVASIAAAITATCVGIVALNVLAHTGLSKDVIGLLFVLSFAVPSVPTTFWLWIWLVRKF